MGGLGMEAMWLLQGVGHLSQFLGLVRQKDSIGELLIIEMNWVQLVVGVARPFWEFPPENHQYVDEKSWIVTLWKFVGTTKGKIVVHNQWVPECGCFEKGAGPWPPAELRSFQSVH